MPPRFWPVWNPLPIIVAAPSTPCASLGTSMSFIAWPSATWGSIPIEGGVAAAYRKEIEAAQDPVAARNALEADYHKIGSPFRTAEKFGIVDIIEPAATRPLLCSWVEDAYALAALSLGPKMRTMR